MSRFLMIGAAQLGPIARHEPRSSAVKRMIDLLQQAADQFILFLKLPALQRGPQLAEKAPAHRERDCHVDHQRGL